MQDKCEVANKIHKLLEDHVADWDNKFEVGLKAIRKIDDMHETIARAGRYAENLNELKNVSSALSDIKDKLIAPATGKKQVPISIFMIVVLVLSSIIILREVKGTGDNVHIGASGMDIGHKIGE